MERTLTHMAEHTEAAAYADLLRAAPVEWQCIAEETAAGWMLFAPALNLLLFNRLVGWGLNAPVPKEELEAALGRYRAAGVTNFGMQLPPESLPPDLPNWLEEAGLERRDSWSKMYRAASDLPESAAGNLRLQLISQTHASSFGAITCAAFGMPKQFEPWITSTVSRPGWYHYLAWDGSVPIAAAAVFVLGDVGWLGIAGTLPAARNRGAQGALMERRLRDGRDLGCRWFVTETGQELPDRPNPSFHNMVRVGFKLAYQRPNYLPATGGRRAGREP
jgi:hypothetical protein